MTTPDDAAMHYYDTWTPDTDPAKAAARFEAKYGQPPERIYKGETLLWVGPVPDNMVTGRAR